MFISASNFVFKGRSTVDYGIWVEEQPAIIRAELEVDTHNVPGRSGTLYGVHQSYKNVVKTAQCALMTDRFIDEISAWLVGMGEVIFSNEPEKVYTAMIKNQIPFTKKGWFKHKIFPVQFDCQPFKHNVNPENDKVILDAPAKIYGKSNYDSLPIIKIYGHGDITLTVNNETVSFGGVTDYITLDSEQMACFRDTTPLDHTMRGKFPVLLSGAFNEISWGGNVNKIEIEPQWRWL